MRPSFALALGLIGFGALTLAACNRKPASQDSVEAPIENAPTEKAAPTSMDNVAAPEDEGASARNESASVPKRPALSRTTDGNRIPAAFLGDWAAKRADCDRPMADTRLTIKPDRVEYYESVGTIDSVEQAGADALVVAASFQGEGQNWTRRQKLTLSDDGDRLVVANQGNSMSRVRCP